MLIQPISIVFMLRRPSKVCEALVHSLASLRDLLFVQLLLFLHRVRVTGHQSPEQGGRVR